ncbi:MAG: HlyC/CorC family transporter [Proteobacteria bacterium]|jgi:Mg2+/Co2+ transporter CorB|nr:HlyC/CorC family transporter [Pseudomonadota bacterium]
MTGTDYIILLAIFALLFMSAFFSGSETALTAASRQRLHRLAKQGDRRAQILLDLFDRKDRLIGAILLGNNVVNILASVLATYTLLIFFGDAGVAYATLIMTLLIVIFAEVLPKTYAIGKADETALRVAPVVRIVVLLLSPLTHTIQLMVRLSVMPFGVKLSGDLGMTQSEEELRGAIDLHEGPDPEVRQERLMLRSILDLDDVAVEDVMTHRRAVTLINASDPIQDIIDQMLASPFTRIPLYLNEPDNIVGVMHAKPLLRELRAKDAEISTSDILALAAKPWFIPETTTLLDQLQAFQERREHFAIVIDEYGAVMGIVTLEDILEEIVGSIEDEQDIAVSGARRQPDGSYVISGSVTLRDLNREFEWALPDDAASTLAGLILHEARRIPEPGQIFTFYGFRFEILRRQRNQITSIRVLPPAPAEDVF